MKKLYFLIALLISFSTIFAQEELSKEEQARREKNIQAGNPFAKYGSKAPVATLSKGKYLEVHDLDSIVTIGTTLWHVDDKKIIGNIVCDSLNIDAQPIGDIPGRWLSPDPLTEEFSDWSPYVSFNNNPVKFTDPTGMATEDCCDGLLSFVAGAVAGTISNVTGSSYLRNGGERSTAFNNGVSAANTAAVVGGTFLAAKGILDMEAGGTGLAASGVATLATAGAGAEVTGPTALASLGAIAVGAIETTVGTFIAKNGVNNMKNDSSSSNNSGNGRGSNNRTADDKAVGDHTVRNENGSTTYKVEPNNPKKNSNGVGFKTEKRVDYKGAAHVDKKTGIKVETPHVQQNGNVRPAVPGKDMPK